MSSALRLGLSRPAAAASHIRRPQPVHTLASTAPSTAAARAFSSTPTTLKVPMGNWRQGTPRDREFDPIPIPKPYAKDAHIPPYPYGPRTTYKQSNSGLYGLARIRFGNNVSPKHNVKTHRKWRPNVHRKGLWSMALGCWVQTRMTMRVLRSIDKVGGLDSYLLGTKPRRIKELGPWGWKLRWRIMQSPVIKQQFRDQRKALGLPPTQEELDEDILREMQEAEALSAREMQGLDTLDLNEITESAGTLTRDGLMAEIDGMLESGEDFPFGNEEDLTLGPDDSITEQEKMAAKEDKMTIGPDEPNSGQESMAPGLEDLAPGPEEPSPASEDLMASVSEEVRPAPLEDTSPASEDLTAPGSEGSSPAQQDSSPALEDFASKPKMAPKPESTSASGPAPGQEMAKDEGFMKEEKP